MSSLIVVYLAERFVSAISDAAAASVHGRPDQLFPLRQRCAQTVRLSVRFGHYALFDAVRHRPSSVLLRDFEDRNAAESRRHDVDL